MHYYGSSSLLVGVGWSCSSCQLHVTLLLKIITETSERERESCLNPSYKITQKLLYTVVCNTVESERERERERESLTNYESNKVDGKDLE